ncbi:asparagine synthase-domain-containing protein [Limtongia smithiae]|uniref:asparagine synthase-domain-containing protein n=1 Tax=Limtongia smithiae TaxID=1125753 RepID=UPI0034CF0965
MCGIFCSVAAEDAPESCILRSLGVLEALRCRGPDCYGERYVETPSGKTLHMYSTVLSMRDPLVAQPLQGSSGILQFNGEIYDLDSDVLLTPAHAAATTNDTALVLQLFERVGVFSTVQLLRGEYAFVYYDLRDNVLWFSRDCVGRRSLLVNRSSSDAIALCSVPPTDSHLRTAWTEVRAGYIYKVSLASAELLIESIPWTHDVSSVPSYPYGHISREVLSSHPEVQLQQFEYLLTSAVRRRALAVHQARPSRHQSYSVLFSGGIDCTIITYLLAKILSKHAVHVDLLNVAFENPRIGGGYSTPDRILGRRSFEELKQALAVYEHSSCTLQLVEINIPFAEVEAHRDRVAQLMYPSTSVMDFSIALAFYHAARSCGTVTTADGQEAPYVAKSRILFSGLGADELFAGYTRHSTCFERGGYDTLAAELELDFGRLHERNLGRDDRVGSHWSRELRYPYLDEDFIAFALKCPLDEKMYRDSRSGKLESKCLLRKFARKVGLKQVAEEKKRAIQFGARSAKMEVGTGKIKVTSEVGSGIYTIF